MVRCILFCFLLTLVYPSVAQWKYPVSKEVEAVDDYNGVKIKDPYRWLEDMKNPQVEKWFKDQAAYSQQVMSRLPGRDKLYEEIMALDNLKSADYASISLNNGNYFYLKTSRGEKVAKLYCRTAKGGKEKLLFDPTTYKEGKTFSITGNLVSNDGKYLSLGLAENGAEIGEARILDLSTGNLLPEVVTPIWGGAITWTQNSKSFIYLKLKTSDNTSNDLLKDMRCMQHTIGNTVESDVEVASRTKFPELPIKPENWVVIYFSDDYKYIFLNIGSVQNELLEYIAPASEYGKDKINWQPFIKLDDEITSHCSIGDKLFFLTHKDAPNYKIGVTDLKNPNFATAKIVVPETDKVIRYFFNTKNYVYYALADAVNKEVFQMHGNTFAKKKIPLNPGNNSVSVLNSKETDDVMCANIGWLIPHTFYQYNPVSTSLVKSGLFNNNTVYTGLENFAIKEVEVKSHDGAMVPLSIVYPKDIKMDGSTACYLDGYGSYGMSISPFFWEPFYALLKQHVVFAVAHVRGGGEKGENWHKGGFKETKPNTWKDYIACAEYLQKNKYTSSQKLIGTGMSAGGILIGNAVAERPDLFGAAIVEVGCTNMLRMETTPNGPNQIPEFGALSNPIELKGLIEMDAQHKIKKGVSYPAVLVRTGYNDPRVIPWMPGKFAATLQNNSSSGKPNLFLVNFENGHFTEDKTVTYKDFADMFSFGLWQTGHKDFQPKAAKQKGF